MEARARASDGSWRDSSITESTIAATTRAVTSLDGRATLLGKPGKLLARASELAVEDCLRVAVKCAVAITHLATTADLGAGSDSRTRLGAGAGNVKPQNMRAIPTSSPR